MRSGKPAWALYAVGEAAILVCPLLANRVLSSVWYLVVSAFGSGSPWWPPSGRRPCPRHLAAVRSGLVLCLAGRDEVLAG
jgi:hypothetical protein